MGEKSKSKNISRRKFLKEAAVGAFSFGMMSMMPLKLWSASAKRPNVVFILIDDLGWKDLSCYGSRLYETPAIDRLAKEGVLFRDAYAAHPRCVPSRFSLMTGKYPARYGVPGMHSNLPTEEFTIAEALKRAGYKTFFAGKWHLAKENDPEYPYPDKQGFDVNYGGSSAGSVVSHFFPYGGIKKTLRGKTRVIKLPGLEKGHPGDYLTDKLTDVTIDFIKKNKDHPFFVYLSHYAVHVPLQAKKPYIKRYEHKLSLLSKPSWPPYIKEGVGETKMIQDNPTYAGMIQSVDDSVNRIMQTLKQLGLEENTIIIFTSDNGGLSTRGARAYKGKHSLATSNFPLRAGKGWCYEGGIRVPLIIKWPGVTKPGTVSEAIVHGADFYPTILQMVGLPLIPKQHLDGISLVPVLKGKEKTARHVAFWHSPVGRPNSTGDENCSVIREDDYKLIDWYDEGRVELYNLSMDPMERIDLSESAPQKRDELYKKLVDWRKEVHAYMAKGKHKKRRKTRK